MNVRLSLAAVATLCVLLAVAPAPSRAAPEVEYHMASESYYRLDVAAGRMSVRVEAELKAVQETAQILLWGMPNAANVTVTQDGTALATESFTELAVVGGPTAIVATLAKPLKPNLKTRLTLAYDVGPQSSELVTIEPGYIEALFVSQGPGSFVFIDIPATGDNYFEPGCLLAADQPGDVRDAGLERWVCGDAAAIAFNMEDAAVQERCARLDDRCRQRATDGPFSAFAQSITDEAKRGVLAIDVPLERGPVRLMLKYFRSDQAWAERQFAMAQRALPLLETLFGFPYPHDVADLRQSHFIEFNGAAGLAFVTKGEMLITNSGDSGFDDEVTVHELAHQWAGPKTLASSWQWEGLAEYAVRRLAPTLGIAPRDWRWAATGFNDPLATWWNGSAVTDSAYWYGKSAAFWDAYAAAIGGPDAMTRVLSAVDDHATRRDGGWFMDTGERVSGQHLDELFLTWVWNRTTSEPLLAERRAAHDLVRGLTDRASELGLAGVPSDIQANLDAWQFRPIAAQVTAAGSVLDEYAAVIAKAAAAGLPQSDGVANAWGTVSTATTRTLIGDQRQAIDAIVGASHDLANEPEGSAALAELAEARERYADGDFAQADRLAAGAKTTAYNEVASGRMIAIAKQKQAEFRPSFLSRIGLFFADPDGDLAAAESALAEGDHAAALRLSRSAYDDWSGAKRRGLMRLAMLMGGMCLVTVGTWYVLRRLDPDQAVNRPLGTGHVIEERRSSWADWDNSKS
ncbi:MAG: hypothetical protein M0R74_05030 [Dehalococcoidia bacterium]|nr:hypothetical protein [Dehalococcoidia bacterium]